MPIHLLPLLAASAELKPSYTGAFSLYSLLLVGLCIFIGFCALVAFIIMAVMGRFRAVPPAEIPHEDDAWEADMQPEYDEADAPPPDPVGAGALEPAPQPRRKTGLWQMITAVAIGLASPLCFALTDNIYGEMRAFTGGTVLQLVLLIAQLVLILLVVWRQRNLN